MARGWESKAVEAQQDDAARRSPARRPLSEAERVAAERRRTLELTRARTVADLSRASAFHHRQMLEQAIEAIDEQLKSLA